MLAGTLRNATSRLLRHIFPLPLTSLMSARYGYINVIFRIPRPLPSSNLFSTFEFFLNPFAFCVHEPPILSLSKFLYPTPLEHCLTHLLSAALPPDPSALRPSPPDFPEFYRRCDFARAPPWAC